MVFFRHERLMPWQPSTWNFKVPPGNIDRHDGESEKTI